MQGIFLIILWLSIEIAESIAFKRGALKDFLKSEDKHLWERIQTLAYEIGWL